MVATSPCPSGTDQESYDVSTFSRGSGYLPDGISILFLSFSNRSGGVQDPSSRPSICDRRPGGVGGRRHGDPVVCVVTRSGVETFSSPVSEGKGGRVRVDGESRGSVPLTRTLGTVLGVLRLRESRGFRSTDPNPSRQSAGTGPPFPGPSGSPLRLFGLETRGSGSNHVVYGVDVDVSRTCSDVIRGSGGPSLLRVWKGRRVDLTLCPRPSRWVGDGEGRGRTRGT